jgi:hypothetical protein
MRRRPPSARLPPIEPLSRPAWDRVEAGVFERMNRGEHLKRANGRPQREPTPGSLYPPPRSCWQAGAGVHRLAPSLSPVPRR